MAAGAMLPRGGAASAAGSGTKLHILGSRAGPSVGSGSYQTSYA